MATVDWVTLAEVKDQLEITGTGRDTAINAAVTAASLALNDRCGRELTPKTADATRTFRVPIARPRQAGEPTLVDLMPHDLRTPVVHVKLHPEETSPLTLVADDEYALWPIGGAKTTGTFTGIQVASDQIVTSVFARKFGYAKLEVKGPWGAWATADVPAEIKRACVVTVGAWIDKAVAEYGDVEEARGFRPSIFSGFAVPMAALSILASADLVRHFRI